MCKTLKGQALLYCRNHGSLNVGSDVTSAQHTIFIQPSQSIKENEGIYRTLYVMEPYAPEQGRSQS